MVGGWRRRHRARKVKPGTGKPLPRYRWWQQLSRALFHLTLDDDDGTHRWSVDVRLWGDSNGEVKAQLYRDGRHHAESTLPADLTVPGGTIEVAASSYGLKRCHYVTADGRARSLVPDPASAEGRRARLERTRPGASRAIGAVSFVVLAIGVVLGLPQLVEQLTAIPPVAERVGSFTSPVRLPAWFNVSLVVGTLVASTERALRLRYHWLLDGGLFDGDL